MATILNYLSTIFGGIVVGGVLAFCFIKFIYQAFILSSWKNIRQIIVSVLWVTSNIVFAIIALGLAGMFLGIFWVPNYHDLVARGEMSTGLIVTFGISTVLGIIITWRSKDKMLEN